MSEPTSGQLTEQELAKALEHTYGTSPGHAAEIAAAHHGRLPLDAEKIPLEPHDPNETWGR